MSGNKSNTGENNAKPKNENEFTLLLQEILNKELKKYGIVVNRHKNLIYKVIVKENFKFEPKTPEKPKRGKDFAFQTDLLIENLLISKEKVIGKKLNKEVKIIENDKELIYECERLINEYKELIENFENELIKKKELIEKIENNIKNNEYKKIAKRYKKLINKSEKLVEKYKNLINECNQLLNKSKKVSENVTENSKKLNIKELIEKCKELTNNIEELVNLYKELVNKRKNIIKYKKKFFLLPLVVIEIKHGNFNTHDVLTYSEKALKHKEIYPYLRYGLVVGEKNKEITIFNRFFRHNKGIDFAYVLDIDNNESIKELVEITKQQIDSARLLLDVLNNENQVKKFNTRVEIKFNEN